MQSDMYTLVIVCLFRARVCPDMVGFFHQKGIGIRSTCHWIYVHLSNALS